MLHYPITVYAFRWLALSRKPRHASGAFPGGPGPLGGSACWRARAPGAEDSTLMAPSPDRNLSCYGRLLIQLSGHHLSHTTAHDAHDAHVRTWWLST